MYAGGTAAARVGIAIQAFGWIAGFLDQHCKEFTIPIAAAFITFSTRACEAVTFGTIQVRLLYNLVLVGEELSLGGFNSSAL